MIVHLLHQNRRPHCRLDRKGFPRFPVEKCNQPNMLHHQPTNHFLALISQRSPVFLLGSRRSYNQINSVGIQERYSKDKDIDTPGSPALLKRYGRAAMKYMVKMRLTISLMAVTTIKLMTEARTRISVSPEGNGGRSFIKGGITFTSRGYRYPCPCCSALGFQPSLSGCTIYGYPREKLVNVVRSKLFDKKFTKGGKVIDMALLPPSSLSLVLHIKRANYVAKIWRSFLTSWLDAEEITESGWLADGETYWVDDIFHWKSRKSFAIKPTIWTTILTKKINNHRATMTTETLVSKVNRDLMNKLKPKNVVCNTFIGSRSNQKKVICKLKLWTAAILNLCKLTTFPVSKSWRLFICSSEGPNKQDNAKKPSIAICSRSSPNLTGINGSTHDKVKRAGETFVLKLYGASNFESLDKYRHIAYKRAIGRCSPSSSFQLASLPPTGAAAKKHSYRTYHTVQEWMGNTLPPIEWGWQSHDGTLAPVETDRPVAPESLLNMVSCS
ncbi:hypothetical protein GQR58_025494 [Nymphon striatum]|nr:hypothetical protein GQR58_025494 [Nymphon striatum]